MSIPVSDLPTAAQQNRFGSNHVLAHCNDGAGRSFTRDDKEVWVFFDHAATNNPYAGGDPNWYYYWLYLVTQVD